MSTYINLFACCIPVKGFKRSTICDLQRNSFLYITNDLYNYLIKNLNTPISELDLETKEVLMYLVENEYAYLTDEKDLFPALSNTTFNDIPNQVNTIIVDLDENSNYNLNKLSSSILDMRIYALEIRIYHIIRNEELISILNKLITEHIRTCYITFKYSELINDDFLVQLISTADVIKQVIIHSAPYNSVKTSFYGTTLIYSKEHIIDESHCGNISPNYFEANMDHFKNRKVNNCLHGKISVSKEGEIKSCPSTKDIYGHIDLNTLRDVVKTKNIKKLWNISKDDINGCKDCEFRYICLDCRAYTENGNKYSKPKKCDYDPYTNKWKNEKN